MKKIYLSVLLGMGMALGSYSYAQSSSSNQNCVNVYNSGLQRSDSVIQVDASNNSDHAKNLESLHKAGYFYKETHQGVRQLSFGDTEEYTTITYTLTDLGRKNRRITYSDLVNDTWSFCK